MEADPDSVEIASDTEILDFLETCGDWEASSQPGPEIIGQRVFMFDATNKSVISTLGARHAFRSVIRRHRESMLEQS